MGQMTVQQALKPQADFVMQICNCRMDLNWIICIEHILYVSLLTALTFEYYGLDALQVASSVTHFLKPEET